MIRMLGWSALLLGSLAGVACARGEVQTERLSERRGDVVVSGEIVQDSSASRRARRPGILLVDDAADSSASKQRAASWARAGRVVLRLDPPEAGRDRSLRTQAEAALAVLRRDARVDGQDLAIVGRNGGAAVAMSLATSGLALDGVVCEGGDPAPPTVEAARRIKSRVLLVSRPGDREERRRDLEDALRRADVDWRAVREGPENPDAVVDAFLSRLWSANTTTAEATRERTAPPTTNPPAAMPRPTPPPPATAPAPRPEPKPSRPAIRLPAGVPSKVAEVLAHVDAEGEAMEGYVGGRTFLNVERRLPQTDRQGRRIRYQEWDVNPLRSGVNRGAERLVTGNDGSAYYTSDHYESFRRIR